MSEIPYEQTTGHLRKLLDIERQGELVAAVLGFDPDIHLQCRGRPTECGDRCERVSCPIQTNTVNDLSNLVMALLEEMRWQRAWAEEVEALKLVPPGTLDRVTLRVRRDRLHDSLREAVEASQAIQGVQVLGDRFVTRIAEIRAELETLDEKLGVQA